MVRADRLWPPHLVLVPIHVGIGRYYKVCVCGGGGTEATVLESGRGVIHCRLHL